MTHPSFHVGDRVITPYGPGTIERLPLPGEAVVRGDDWAFFGSFKTESLALSEAATHA